MNDLTQERIKDLGIATLGFSIASVSLWARGKIQIQDWIMRFGVYAGILATLLYVLRLKLAAEEIDPDSHGAFKEYLKLGSCYIFILFVAELPLMLASLS